MDYEQLEDFNEALSAAIQSGLDVSCHAVTDMYKETLARAEAAERRIAELEAQLAAQAWRPVDDLDLDRGSDVDILARGHYDPEMGGVMLDSRDFLLSDGEDFIAWRPRTTSPIDPPAPA